MTTICLFTTPTVGRWNIFIFAQFVFQKTGDKKKTKKIERRASVWLFVIMITSHLIHFLPNYLKWMEISRWKSLFLIFSQVLQFVYTVPHFNLYPYCNIGYVTFFDGNKKCLSKEKRTILWTLLFVVLSIVVCSRGRIMQSKKDDGREENEIDSFLSFKLRERETHTLG